MKINENINIGVAKNNERKAMEEIGEKLEYGGGLAAP